MSIPLIRLRFLQLCALASLSAPVLAGGLTVYPSHIDLTGADREHGLVVLVTRDDGHTLDVTRRCEFASRTPQIVTVDRTGACRAQADGAGEIEVKFEKETATVPVGAHETAQKVVPSF